jgi:hypothetical protein
MGNICIYVFPPQSLVSELRNVVDGQIDRRTDRRMLQTLHNLSDKSRRIFPNNWQYRQLPKSWRTVSYILFRWLIYLYRISTYTYICTYTHMCVYIYIYIYIYPSFQPHFDPGDDSDSNKNEYQEYFLGGKSGRCVGLTTLQLSCADCLEILEPQPPVTFRACPGL